MGAAALDGVLALGNAATVGVLTYTLAVNTLAGLALGLTAAVTVIASQRCGVRAITRALPAAAVGAAALLLLNTTLFDGPQIRLHPQLGLIKAAFYVAVPVGTLVAALVFPILLRCRRPMRWAAAAAAVMTAVACTWAGLHLLNAYPMIKVQLALGTWMSLTAALVLAYPRWQEKALPRALLVATFAAVALGAAGAARDDSSIRRVRSLIIDRPLPNTLRAINPTEKFILDPLFPLPTIEVPSGAPARVVSDVESPGAQTLDGLIPGRRKMNVLWLAIDALRADHVGAYGYKRPTTPNIDALAKESVLFLNATSPTPASALAYSSTMTGLFGRRSPAYDKQHRLGGSFPDETFVAHLLGDSGRHTMGLTSFFAGTINSEVFRPLAKGFDEFNPGKRGPAIEAPEVTDRALLMLDRVRPPGKPWFFWLHYLDPHAPYEFKSEHPFGDTQIDAYDSEIAYTDVQVGRLFDELKKRGLYDSTIIVLFSDHGEAFGEHNNRQHGGSLYSHQINVPLMIRVPGLKPKAVEEWAGLSDLAPTTLSLVGLSDPVKRLGRDLTPLMIGSAEGWVDSIYAERPAPPRDDPPSKERTVCSGDLKLIWKPHHHTYQVFDLAKNPGETRNLFDPESEQHQQLLRLLDGWDRRIDGAPEAAPGTAKPKPLTLSAQLLEATRQIEAAPDMVTLQGAVGRAHAMLDLPAISGLPVNTVLFGDEAMTALKSTLLERLPGIPDRSVVRAHAIDLLTFTDDPALLPLMAKEMDRTSNRRVLARLALFRARHGDRSVLPAIDAIYSKTNVQERVMMAEALAYLGDDRGQPLLRGSLALAWDRLIGSAVRGLAALDDPYPCYTFLFSQERQWQRQHQLDVMLEAGLKNKSVVGNAALMRLGSIGSDHVATAARAELARRTSAAIMSRFDPVANAVEAARQACEYSNYGLTARSFSPLRGADDPLVGPYWWMLAQGGWETDRGADQRRGIERLSAVAEGNPELLSLVARMEQFADAAPRPPANALKLSARLLGEPVTTGLGRRKYFYADVAVTNTSESQFVSGGWWRTGPLIGWSVEPLAGPKTARPLPIDGLEPGETKTMTVVGQWPNKAGSYTPRLVVVSRPKGQPIQELLTLQTQVLE